MFVKIPGIRISHIRAAVPSREIKIEDELEFYGGSLKKAQRAKKMIGTDRRRLVWPGQTAADLCEAAARAVIAANADIKENIDALIFVSQTPDYDLPATANILQAKLGLSQNCAAFDANQGCSGYVYGLWLGASLIGSGCNHVLVLAGDAPYRPLDVRNRMIAPIFGNGGSATLMQKQADAPPMYFSLGSDGSGFEHIIVPAGRGRIPYSEKSDENVPILEDIVSGDGFPWQLINTYMDGSAVFSFTLNVIPGHLSEFIERSGFDKASFDNFVLHQANRQIIEALAKKMDFPMKKTPSDTFSRYGNLSSASIPAALCDLFGKNGSTGKRRLLLSGFGVGLSWASCIWEADNCDIAPVINVDAPNASHSRDALIKYWREKIKEKTNEQ